MEWGWLSKIAPAFIGVIGAVIGWFLKSKLEAKRRVEKSLRDEAAKVYLEILMPFAVLFTDLSPKSQQETLKKMKSKEYREKSFKLILVGSDEVVLSWNEMWNIIYKTERGESESNNILLAFGNVLLSIRKSLGNTNTTMNNKDMLRWLIKDIDILDANV